jgi:3-oxoacyl-[acyl-carrier-protein] synthase III
MKIRSVAHALPSRLVTNEDLVDRLDERNRGAVPAAELDAIRTYLQGQLQRTGAETRYHRAQGQKAFELGMSAATRALEQASMSAEDIDLLIFTGVGRGFVEPATANVFQSELGMANATCFDLLDACASWLRGVDVARHLIASGAYRHAMVLNCEANFAEYEPVRVTSLQDIELLWSGFTVGEAATATILAAGDAGAEYRTTFRNAGAYLYDCQIPLPHAAQFQNGHARAGIAPMLFQARPDALAGAAVKQLHKQFWSDPELTSRQYDIIFGHTVSVPVSQAVLRLLKLDPERFYEIFPTYGNVVSASLPLAMSLAQAEGRLERGDRVLLVMGGAGLTTAFSTFVY